MRFYIDCHIIYYGVMGGRIIKIVNNSAVHLLLKWGGFTFEGGVFSVEYGIYFWLASFRSGS